MLDATRSCALAGQHVAFRLLLGDAASAAAAGLYTSLGFRPMGEASPGRLLLPVEGMAALAIGAGFLNAP